MFLMLLVDVCRTIWDVCVFCIVLLFQVTGGGVCSEF